jgi:hypothetical protein
LDGTTKELLKVAMADLTGAENIGSGHIFGVHPIPIAGPEIVVARNTLGKLADS